MGEITDALRRANAEREARAGADAAAPAPHAPLETPWRGVESSPAAPSARGPRYDGPLTDALGTPHEPVPIAKEPEDDAAERLEISREKTGAWAARAVVIDRRGGNAEAYRHFAIRVGRELDERQARSVLIVSALRLEGKTTTSCNLALALASMAGGRRTALVDLDLRRPAIGKSFGVMVEQGLDSVLLGRAELADARVATTLESLDLYPVATHLSQPHEVLAGPSLPALIRQLEASYDHVIIDSPPVLLVPDVELILPHVGGCVAVIRAGQSHHDSCRRMVERLPPHSLLGTFLNDTRSPRHSKQYGYYLNEELNEELSDELSEDPNEDSLDTVESA